MILKRLFHAGAFYAIFQGERTYIFDHQSTNERY